MAPKLKVLCLHGYMQNSTTFHSRLGSWRKALKASVEFVCIDGPHVAQTSEDPSGAERSWWIWEDQGQNLRPSRAANYSGWEVTEAAIQAALVEHGPIHGMVGFSQGACCAARYSVRALRSEGLPKPRFVVLISGFLPRDESWAAEMRDTGLGVPTFHAYGKEDEIIRAEQSEGLVGICDAESATRFMHPGGHFIPTCAGEVRGIVREFFGEQHAQMVETDGVCM